MNGGWLPPGCTDKDIDDACPSEEPSSFEEIEEHSVASDCASIKYAFERIIKTGARATAMSLIEDLIKEYALDKWLLHDRHYRGEDAE